MNKLEEVKKILNKKVNINIQEKIKYLKEKYEEELKEFTYIENEKYFLKNKNFYVRYVGFNNKLYYGGFFYKYDKNTSKIFLVNTYRKIWSIDFNKNYVFINKILSRNEQIRKSFEEYLKSLN